MHTTVSTLMGIVIIVFLVLLFIVLMFAFPGGTGVLH